MRLITRFSHHFRAKFSLLRSLRTRLGLAIGGIALVLSLLASLIVGHTVSEQLKVNVGDDLADVAYQMTDKLDRGMFERYRDIQIISTLNAIRDPKSSVSSQRSLLEKLQSTYTDYAWIGFTDNQGVVRASTGTLLEGKSVSQREWFIKGQKAPYVGDVHDAVKLAKLLPNTSGEPLRFVDVAVPVMDLENKPQGVLGAHLSWKWSNEIKESLLRQRTGSSKTAFNLIPNEEMFILREDGEQLLGPPGFNAQPQASALPAKSLSLASVKAAQRGLNSYAIETWPDGNTYLTGFARSAGYRNYPGLGWLVLVRQKIDVAFAPAQQIQQQILAVNLSLGALFAVLGWVVAAEITNPMLAIAAAAEKIRLGNTSVKIPILQGKDEIANLSKSLSRLVHTLIGQEKELKASNEQLQLELVERQRAEESLRQSEEKFRQLAEHIQEVFWISDPQANEVLYISPAYEQIWGSPCESVYANPESWLDAVHPEDRECANAIQLGFIKGSLEKINPQIYNIEYRIIHPDGSVRWIWSRAFPVRNAMGEVYRQVGVAQDITERKVAEETRKALEQEKQLSELKSHFMAIASHEFRTPLTSILMVTGMLEKYSEQLSEEKKQQYFYQLRAAIKRITHLLDDILILGRAEAGKLEFNPAPLDLVNFCKQIAEDLQFAAGEKYQVNFVPQCVGADYTSPIHTCLDENLLRHILTNLLSNAIKYSPEGGNVQFDLICDYKSATFRIQDRGIGIPPADKAKLFTSFYRCSNTGKISGTGLGLTIVKEAVELHGGQITVESEVGFGTTFIVTLPLQSYTKGLSEGRN